MTIEGKRRESKNNAIWRIYFNINVILILLLVKDYKNITDTYNSK